MAEHPQTTADMDGIDWAPHQWIDGQYPLSPRRIHKTIVKTALNHDSHVPRTAAAVHNEGYAGFVELDVWTPDPDTLETNLDAALDDHDLSDDQYQLKVHGNQTGDEAIAEFRDAASNHLPGDDIDTIIAAMLEDDEQRINDILDDRDQDGLWDTVIRTETITREDPLSEEPSEHEREVTLRHLLRSLVDVQPETRGLVHTTVTVHLEATEKEFV